MRNPDDPEKPLTAHFFVTTIDISDYTFCEAFPNEKTNNYVEGLADAFTFYDALPHILRPDNHKTIVIKNNNNNQEIALTHCISLYQNPDNTQPQTPFVSY